MKRRTHAVPGARELPLFDRAPPNALSDGQFLFGRYREPIWHPQLGAGLWRLRLKEWAYASICTREWWVACAVVQLQYAAQAFAYVVERKTGRARTFGALSPLGRALRMAPSSVAGTSEWRTPDSWIAFGFDGAHVLELDLSLSGARLTGRIRIEPDDALALLFPLSSRRAAYTHKAAGMRASGSLRLDGQSLDLTGALASLDWTRSLADRHTRWNWASFVGRTESGKRFGLNLSAHVYDLAGASMENGVWLDGRMTPLGAVQFEVPAPTTAPWRIHSTDGSDEVALELEPQGERRAVLNVGVLRSVFAQPYGTLRGVVRGERVDGAYGVVEDHDALW